MSKSGVFLRRGKGAAESANDFLLCARRVRESSIAIAFARYRESVEFAIKSRINRSLVVIFNLDYKLIKAKGVCVSFRKVYLRRICNCNPQLYLKTSNPYYL